MKQLQLNGRANSDREHISQDSELQEVYERMLDGDVAAAMTELLPILQAARLRSLDLEWPKYVARCLHHPLRGLLHQDPFTYRAFTKPRGYAGDAILLDYIYGREEGWPVPEGASELGQQIYEFTTCSSACEGVRARRGFIANMLDQLADRVARPHVLSIASGHLRECLLSAAVKRRKIGRLVAFDADAESLEEVRRCYSAQRVEAVQGSIRELVRPSFDLGQFDFVYSTGLFDYLPLAAGQRLIGIMFRMLRTRGQLLVANFLPGILDVGYMETYMAWSLTYRNRREMLDLALEIPQSEIRDIRLFAEENQNIIFLEVTRR